MKKILVLLVAVLLIIPTLVQADEKLLGVMDFDLANEIQEDTDLIKYLFDKAGTSRDEAHITRDFIDGTVRRSAGNIISPHFVECWEDPYYMPRWTKRVTGSLRGIYKRPDAMFQYFLSSQVRTGYMTNWYMAYMPTVDVDEEKPLEKALEDLYEGMNEWQESMYEAYVVKFQIGNTRFTVNDKEYESLVAPVIVDGSTFIPIRALTESLGAVVEFDSNTRTVFIRFSDIDDIHIELKIDNKTALVNGKEIELDKPAMIIANSMMIPLRFIADTLGFEIDFIASEKRIILTRVMQSFEDIKAKNLEAIKGIDLTTQEYIATYLLQMKRTGRYRDYALRELPKDRWEDLHIMGRYHMISSKDETNDEFMKYLEEIYPEDGSQIQWDMAHDFDYNDMYYGAAPLITTTESLKAFILKPIEKTADDSQGKPIDLAKYNFELELPYGKFAFNGKSENNTYDCKDYYSIIDLGGNDTYNGPAASTYKVDRPVSTVIDWKGNDTYESDKTISCSQGFGMMGVGILLDYKGDDSYTSYDNAQGGCFFGVGILHDEGGDDVYYGRNIVQGGASFGVGTLLDVGGNDLYYSLMTSQGFGYVGGCGMLVDSEGNDTYLGETGHKGEGWSRTGRPGEGWGLQTAATGGHDNDRNYTFVQGAGWGRRADMGDGHGMGGGTGILLDVAGNDFYECGVYGQATGYWFGTGILNDIEGDDEYHGSFFVQSGTAHMGLTELLDEAGDDTYQVFKAISNGGAHDFSNTWFIDKQGDDKYLMYDIYDELDDEGNPTGETYKYAGGELCGGAITNSHGVHIDYGGDDYYEMYTARSLGYCLQRTGPAGDSYRHFEWNVGLFINRGGNDLYKRTWERENNVPEEWPQPDNNSCWKQVTQPGNLDYSIGFGLDVDKGVVPEAEW
ncbi:MAG TPA: copper amine oxidase N-terminal domain-containing protein [Caldisericia bacterium]|nr:copper amine oxidase N-terminal domain-containing protein [Caldisericia bacterium]HPF48412.1 copper amine oxidase N-terminal domain-containing protein [Caldisericia bacterium]HPI83408.1 copper amine oxidase N-terminal domain-containing protein [Caldisericia bacterium]HPQ92866.1 copper amine oxidase N-terminal domain-containing protein [Caldisericia bacterium]HRV74036.1 copper amine oxidase N-terminal domain-containing protein [Caldisericia bacterium]